MKKRWLCLVMALCLLFSLAACSSGGEAEESPGVSTEVSPEATQSEPAESETEKETEKATEPAEEETPTQPEEEEPTETPQGSGSSADFLKLLQQEYEVGSVSGKSKEHTYYSRGNFDDGVIIDDMVYYRDNNGGDFYTYNRSTKESKTSDWLEEAEKTQNLYCYLDGHFYFYNASFPYNLIAYSADGQQISSVQLPGEEGSGTYFFSRVLGDSFFYYYNYYDENDEEKYESCVVSKDLQTVTVIPQPEREIEHGIMEQMPFGMYEDCHMLAVDGTVFGIGEVEDKIYHMYQLDLEAGAWSDLGEVSPELDSLVGAIGWGDYPQFYGKYHLNQGDHSIFDATTGEKVYECEGTIYPAYYFGGDSCVARDSETDELRLLNLKDGTLSDPLKLPEKRSSSAVRSETDFIYKDQFGIFLWDMNTGKEETIVMFD